MHEGDRVLVRNMTPRGGTGKLRNHWEDSIHKVIRQVGKNMPIYEVIPEQGKGRGRRILHHNLLLPCDSLPLEIQLQPAKQKRKVTPQTSKAKEVIHQEDNESDDEDYGYYYMPMGEPLSVMQPVNTEREDVNDAEHQQQNIPQQQDAQDIGDMLGEEEILDQEEMHVQEEPVVEERMSAWSHGAMQPTVGWMTTEQPFDYQPAIPRY